jgi:hypothetical protein
MNRLSLPLALVALLASPAALADAVPTCDQFAQSADCDQASSGQNCSGGGVCTGISCEGAGPGGKIFKCVSCQEAEIPDPDKVCEPGPSSFGKACGDGGTCTRLPSWCGSSGYVVCAKASPGAGGSGGSGQAGSGGSGQAGSGTAGSSTAGSSTAGSGTAGTGGGEADDSSCAVSQAGRHGALAGLMLALGAAAMLFERRRR